MKVVAGLPLQQFKVSPGCSPEARRFILRASEGIENDKMMRRAQEGNHLKSKQMKKWDIFAEMCDHIHACDVIRTRCIVFGLN